MAIWWTDQINRKHIAIQTDLRSGNRGTICFLEPVKCEHFPVALLVARWIVQCRSVETADVDKQLLDVLAMHDRAMAGCRENEDRIRKHFQAEMETLHKGIDWRDRRIAELEQQLAKMPAKQASLFNKAG